MIDDPETPISRSNGEPEPNVEYDDHGQRREYREPDEAVETQETSDRYELQFRKLARQNPDVTIWDPEFQGDWINYFSKHINPQEARVFNALYSSESFAEFVSQTREEVKLKLGYTETQVNSNPKNKEKLEKELSKTLERKIVMSIGKLFIKVDEKHSNETFEQIETSNFMNSIRVSFDIIQDKIGLLKKELKNQSTSGEISEKLKNLTFYKKYSEEEVVTKSIKRKDKQDKLDFDTRPIPTPKSVPASVDEFLRYTSAQVTHFVELRRYLHDITVLFKRGPGQEGFWSQVAEFAKQITTSDIDSMMLLPDSELFMTAHNLYIKHLTSLMARNSWTHKPGMFSADFFEINTDVETRVLEDLKRLFPDIKDEESERFQRAVKMGVGISRGITLAEVEIAASADPPYVINSEGKREVSYESLYISDAAPLLAFRGIYNAERFLPRDLTEGPLLYAPVSNFKKKPFWNHNELWERMQEYEKSYHEGRDAINIKDDTELLIDAAENFGKVGGIEFRSGWRPQRGYDAWLRTIPDFDLVNRGRLDYLESWKQLENIGYLPLQNFITNKMNHLTDGEEFLLGKREWKPGEREDFFNYLYDKYINFDPTTGGRFSANTLNDEINNIKNQIRIKNPNKSEEYVEKEAYKRLVSKALFGLLRQRVPTLFIRLDRDRKSDKGEDAYKEILKKNGWDFDTLDDALRDLGDVEMKLRLKVSDEMKNYLAKHDKDLADPNIRYIVTEEFIRDTLEDMLKGEGKEQKINNAVKLFQVINNDFLKETTKFAQDRVEMMDKGKYKFTLAVEEQDSFFLAYRAAGDSVLHRAIKDTALIEKDVSGRFQEHIKLLRKVAKDPNRDISKLIENLSEIRSALAVLHGDVPAWEKTSMLVGATIDYFRKDFIGRMFWGIGGIGRMNSLAAENEGTWRGIWEWDNADIDSFIVECERERILPKYARDLKLEPKVEEKSFLGFKYKVVTHKENEKIMTGAKARKMFGATQWDLMRGNLLKLGPLILGLVLFNAIKKALEEEKKK